MRMLKFNVSQTWLFIQFCQKMHPKVAVVPYYSILISASKNGNELILDFYKNLQLNYVIGYKKRIIYYGNRLLSKVDLATYWLFAFIYQNWMIHHVWSTVILKYGTAAPFGSIFWQNWMKHHVWPTGIFDRII